MVISRRRFDRERETKKNREMSRGGKSYWSRYREVHKIVSSHLNDIGESHSATNENADNLLSDDQNLGSDGPDNSVNRASDSVVRDRESSDDNVGDINNSDHHESSNELIFSESSDSSKSDNDADDRSKSYVCAAMVYSEDSSKSDEEEVEERVLLPEKLRNWAVTHQVTVSSLGDLLKIFRPLIPELPKDPRTLLKTPTQYNIVQIYGGEYYHFGINDGILTRIKYISEHLPENFLFELQVNIDGLPLFKSTSQQFWPILGSLRNVTNKDPFVIGLFSGNKKPTDVEFLRRFIDEYNELHRNGFEYKSKHWKIKLHSVICDAPARAFVKCIKLFNGYHGCDKCEQNGTWMGKMTYPETNSPLRTDNSYRRQSDDEHHQGDSPFLRTEIGMISQFPIDYMHQVCLGVMKRLLLIWIKGPLPSRLGPGVIASISENLIKLRNHIPNEFSRKPRSLREIDRWKATEYRQFLLYTGPVVLKQEIHTNMYKNFLLFSVAFHLLLNENLCRTYNEYAKELLKTFVRHFCELYGYNMAVYNVHSLIHLPDDALRFGTLDNISSFPFENFLHRIKRMVRKPEFALQQVIRRLHEQNSLEEKDHTATGTITLHKEHITGPLLPEFNNVTQYKTVKTGNFQIRIDEKDSCVQIDGKVCVVKNIIKHETGIKLIYNRYRNETNFFDVPLDSSLLGIKEVFSLGNTFRHANIDDVQSKYTLLPYRNGHSIAFPMCHNVCNMMDFAIVEFRKSSEIAVVPSKWISKDKKRCYWPINFKTSKLTAAVRQRISANVKEFESFEIKVMYETDDYEKARQKLKQAEFDSDLQTEVEDEQVQTPKRQKRPNPRYIDSGSETETEDDTPLRRSPRKIARTTSSASLPPLPKPPAELIAGGLMSSSSTHRNKDETTVTPKSKSLSRSEFEVKVLTCLEHIKRQVQDNAKTLHVLEKKMNVTAGEDNEEDETVVLPDMPVKDEGHLEEVEQLLQNNAAVKKRMIRSLSTIGGDNTKQSVRRIMKNLVSNSLAMKLNWLGRGNKRPFSGLILKDVLFASVRRNRLCKEATDKEIEDVAKDWLKFSKDREGGRKDRKEKKTADSESQNIE